jgi:D-hexose-6-phosphate mutarotase
LDGAEVDRVYGCVPDDRPVTVRDYSGRALYEVSRHCSLSHARGLHGGQRRHASDVVLWNIGRDKCEGVADFGATDYQRYVCVEPGRVSPESAVSAAEAASGRNKGQKWTLWQSINVLA